MSHNIYLHEESSKAYKPIYLVLIDKKTNEKNIYCILLNLKSMNFSRVINIKEGEIENTINIEYLINPNNDDCILQYEVYSKEEIQKLEKNLRDSHVSSMRSEVLMTFENIENMNLN